MAFNVAAESYDRYIGIWAQQLAPRFADFAGIGSGMRVLDVGCGPGALTSELVARTGPERVAAIEPSASFVAAARDRLPGVEVLEAAAEAIPYPDAAFDAALAQLVVHFMRDPVKGPTEMTRVVRPGGVVAACVWDYGEGRGPLGPFWEAALALDPAAVDESRLAGARRGHLLELLVAAGLADVAQAELNVSRQYDDFDDWWDPFTRGVGPGGAYLAGLSAERQAELRGRCREMLPQHGPFTLDAVAWAARGLKPS